MKAGSWTNVVTIPVRWPADCRPSRTPSNGKTASRAIFGTTPIRPRSAAPPTPPAASRATACAPTRCRSRSWASAPSRSY